MSRSRSTLDNELIREFKAGDTRAFEAIVVRYQKPIVNFIYRMIGDFQEAEDIAQEVFIKIYRFAHTYEGRSTFASWLFGIASNLCYDSLRTRSHWDRVFPDAEETAVREQILGESKAPSPEELAENSEIARFIESAVGQLPIQQRQALVLREYYGLSYKEIADAANCSVAAVKSRIHKAKQRLGRKLDFLLD
jgi:RNA polymerase sigma-70 factor (ECF subfamily)